MLALAGVEPGDPVAELAAGGGYYTALLSRVAGESGKVYAVDPELIFKAFPNGRKPFPEYAESDPRENVDYFLADRFDALTFPEPLDAIFLVRYYHDTVWTGEDRPKMNRALYDALKPGGVLVVIDHHAMPGAGEGVTKSLHRVDAATVRPELEAAGFELRSDSDLLRNPDYPRTQSVFAEDIRNQTDRFFWLFEKSADE